MQRFWNLEDFAYSDDDDGVSCTRAGQEYTHTRNQKRIKTVKQNLGIIHASNSID